MCNNDYCDITPEKRDLDGAYFRVERDGEWEDVCFSDMTETERNKIMGNKGVPWLMKMANHLADRLHDLGDQLDIRGE